MIYEHSWTQLERAVGGRRSLGSLGVIAHRENQRNSSSGQSDHRSFDYRLHVRDRCLYSGLAASPFFLAAHVCLYGTAYLDLDRSTSLSNARDLRVVFSFHFSGRRVVSLTI